MKVKDFFVPYITYMKMDGRADKTIEEHERFLYGIIGTAIGEREVDSLLITDLANVRELAETHGEHGPQRAIIVARRLLTYIRHSGNHVPFDVYEYRLPRAPLRRPKYLSRDDLMKLRSFLDRQQHTSYIRCRAIIELLISTGARVGEILPLDISDVNWEKKEIQVVNAKTKDEETIYPTDTAYYWLRRYIEQRRDVLPALFVSGRGRMLRVTSAARLAEIGRQAGLSVRLNHKVLRSTYVTYLLDGGARIHDVQKLARHKSERTTLKHYAAHDTKRAVEVHRRIMELV